MTKFSGDVKRLLWFATVLICMKRVEAVDSAPVRDLLKTVEENQAKQEVK